MLNLVNSSPNKQIHSLRLRSILTLDFLNLDPPLLLH